MKIMNQPRDKPELSTIRSILFEFIHSGKKSVRQRARAHNKARAAQQLHVQVGV